MRRVRLYVEPHPHLPRCRWSLVMLTVTSLYQISELSGVEVTDMFDRLAAVGSSHPKYTVHHRPVIGERDNNAGVPHSCPRAQDRLV